MLNYYEFIKNNPEIFKQFSCKEVLFVIIDCPPDFVKSEDLIEHNCFLYAVTGKHELYSRERSWLLKEGETIFIKKGGVGIKKIDEDVFCALMFYVPDSFLRSFIREKIEIFSGVNASSAISGDVLLSVETNDVLKAFYESVISYFASGKNPAEELIELKFKELLLNIVTDPSNKELTTYLYKLFSSSADEIRDVMERNYLYDLQLEEFARLCHRSLASFKRDFLKLYGVPPGRWLLEKRLEAASRLLLAPDKSVNDVAIESGFKNNTHFSRVFKNFFGASPLRFRKEQLTAQA